MICASLWKNGVVCLFLLCSSIGLSQVTAVRAGRLIDPDGGIVLADQIILIQDSRIQAVGKGIAIPSGANIIDLSTKTVLPGLIDCHTHIADGESPDDPFEVLRNTASQIALASVPNARNTLLAGF